MLPAFLDFGRRPAGNQPDALRRKPLAGKKAKKKLSKAKKMSSTKALTKFMKPY